jgi:hypothetical protein
VALLGELTADDMAEIFSSGSPYPNT